MGWPRAASGRSDGQREHTWGGCVLLRSDGRRHSTHHRRLSWPQHWPATEPPSTPTAAAAASLGRNGTVPRRAPQRSSWRTAAAHPPRSPLHCRCGSAQDPARRRCHHLQRPCLAQAAPYRRLATQDHPPRGHSRLQEVATPASQSVSGTILRSAPPRLNSWPRRLTQHVGPCFHPPP
jgi:hypothetical protein